MAHQNWNQLFQPNHDLGRGFLLYEDDVIKPNGEAGKYTYIQSPPFVLVVGYEGERFILVCQFRYPLRREMIEFSGGSVDEGKGPLEAAKREFEEETGLKADKWTKMVLQMSLVWRGMILIG